MGPSGHSVCGYNSPTCNRKIFRNAAEGPYILLILVSPPWGMTQQHVDHVLKHGHNTGTSKGICATREGLLSPSHRKLKHRTKGFAFSNVIKANGAEITFWSVTSFTRWRKVSFPCTTGIFCFNNRTRKPQPQAFIQLCCRRSNTAPKPWA